MNDIYITLTGNVAAPPRQHAFADGSRVTSLRVATRHRFFDRKTQEWSDGDTVFFAVRCWRTLGDNVAQSFQVGHPVVVCGKLRIREFGPEGDRRFMPEIEASSIGHDLRWGVGAFSKPERSGGIGTLSKETRESLDESTQDWAMSGAANVRPLHARPVPAAALPFAEEAAQDDAAGWPFPVAPAEASTDMPTGPASETAFGPTSGAAFGLESEGASGRVSEAAIGAVPETAIEHVSETAFGPASEGASGRVSEAAIGAVRETAFGPASAATFGPASEDAFGRASEATAQAPSEVASGPTSQSASEHPGGPAPAAGNGDTITLAPAEGDDNSPSAEPDADPGAGHGGAAGKVRILTSEDAPRAATPRSRRSKAA
ncbi:single-stranded DNA-binding protein [Nonomuraea sp. NPDC059194]|uniref:single-stranded DNA-binding protein n=1 Tax=Nonomuraea sp. NPDC059194 TaxID=3346764 RepID=UPI0036A38352